MLCKDCTEEHCFYRNEDSNECHYSTFVEPMINKLETVLVKTEVEESSWHEESVLTVNPYGYVVFSHHIPKGHKYIELNEFKKLFTPNEN